VMNRYRPLLSRVREYYAQRLSQHGPTPAGVDWNGSASQQLRHFQFTRLFDSEPESSILDLGCGYGDFLPFVRSRGHRGPFIGYDIAESMIEAARELHGEGPDRSWNVGAVPQRPADYAVASGIFNVKGDTPTARWSEYVQDTIEILGRSSVRGFGFNVLSMSSDPERRRGDLYYADPVQTLAFCLSRFGRRVALLQDYGLYEFTVLVRHY
jgi:SAM-dependent methyltransferase